MRILGIESSCDETAAAVVEDAARVVSQALASQLDTHGKYGGVVPELASREHLRAITPVVREAVGQAGGWEAIDAVAVTEGPGLVGALLVGITYAKAISYARGLPLIAVNHLEGHIHAVVLEARIEAAEIEFPAVALIVSGGHTHLFHVALEELARTTELGAPAKNEFFASLEGRAGPVRASDFAYRLLGRTRDDAAGEAYDKVAKLLGFGYPGGPVIDQLAPLGNPSAVKFTLAKMKGNPLDFSFSGIKTAVLRWVESHGMDTEIAARRALASHRRPTLEEWKTATPQHTLDLLASFQATVIEELLRRARSAVDQSDALSLIISGGVAANRGLRAAVQASGVGCPAYFPRPSLSTDNAVMIAAAAFPKLARSETAGWDLKARANLPLA